MSRRRKILIIAGILIVILILLLLWFLRPHGTSQNPQVIPTQVPVTTTPPPAPTADQQAAVAQQVHDASVSTVAKLFAERYGSYSTEAQFGNVTDVLGIVTASYGAQLQAQIASAKPSPEYYGVSTVALSVNVDAMDDASGTAHTIVSTQRTEAKGSQQNTRTFYQKLDLTFAKEDGQWKVAGSTWE